MRRAIGAATALAFLACILLANWVTTEYGIISVGFGLTATAGTYFAGATFVLRDAIQDLFGRGTRLARRVILATISAGALLSYAAATWIFEPGFLPPGVTAEKIAAASAAAFFLSELADFAIYSPLRDKGYARAALASNVVGAVVDTFVFLWLSGFGIAVAVVEGQVIGKLTLTAVAVGLYYGGKAARA